MVINGINFQSGQPVKCKIKGVSITGKIHIAGEEGRAWICHPNSSLSGNESPNLWGFPYSWIFRYRDGELSDDVSDIVAIEIDGIQWKVTTMSQEFTFLLQQLFSSRELQIAFNTVLEPFENFNEVQMSDKPGFLLLKGFAKTENGVFPKKVEIKLSRYLKKISDSYVSFLAKKDKVAEAVFTEPVIESIYNKFVAYANGDFLKLRFLSGSEIDYGYNVDNYARNLGTVSKSCMTNKFEFFDIYRQNKNCRLAILESENGVEARCLVWETEEGTYYDRIYSTYDWLADVMQNKLNAMNFKNLCSINLAKITLEHNAFAQYPYIDSFRFQLKGTNDFYKTNDVDLLPKGKYKVYCNTGGTWANHECR